MKKITSIAITAVLLVTSVLLSGCMNIFPSGEEIEKELASGTTEKPTETVEPTTETGPTAPAETNPDQKSNKNDFGFIKNGFVDVKLFGGEDNIELKVGAPNKAIKLVKEQIADFIAAYPQKRIKIEVVGLGEGEAGTVLLNDAITAPNVFGFASDQLSSMAKEGVIAPVAFPEYCEKINSDDSTQAGKVDGTLFAYPETNDNGYYLVYDKSVVSDSQAGTLEGVLQACKSADKSFIFNCGDGFFSCAFAFTGGVMLDGLDDDGYTQRFTQYDEGEAVATLQAFSKLMHDYKGTFISDDCVKISEGFASGTCGAGVDGTWNSAADNSALRGNLGVAKLPTIKVNGKDKQIISITGYKFIGVNSHSKFPAAAQALALYLSDEKCQKDRAEQLGWGPTNLKVRESDAVKKNPFVKAITEQSKNSCKMVDVSASFWEPMGNLGNKLISDSTNPNDQNYFKKLLQETIKNCQDE